MTKMGCQRDPSKPRTRKRKAVYSMDKRVNKLDRIFSEFIRRRAIARCGGCEYSGVQVRDIEKENGSVLPAWMQLECSHVIGRNNRKVRWDEDNAFGLLGSWHIELENSPAGHREFAIKKLGQRRFNHLLDRSHSQEKVDIDGMIRYYEQKIKNGEFE